MTDRISKDNPCHHCQPPKRHVGCHAECQEHREWKNAIEEFKTKYWEARCKADMLDSMEKDRAKHRWRRRHSK